MRENRDKLKELWENKYAKPLLFFGFYFIFFAIVFAMINNVRTNDNENVQKDMWDNISSNYEYLYEVKFSDNQVINLEGKKYNNKNLFTKKINGIIDSEVYAFYNDISIKKDGTWVDGNNYVFVSDSFNNQLLDIKYIKSLVADSELMDSVTDFDGSKTDNYTFNNLGIEVVSNENVIKKVVIVHPLYKVILQYKNINNVGDFVVEK